MSPPARLCLAWRKGGRVVWPALGLVLLLAVVLTPLPTAVSLAIAIAVGVLAFASPTAGIAALAFAVPFGSAYEGLVGRIPGEPTEWVLALTLTGWLSGVVTRRERVRLGPLFWPTAAFVVATLLSAAFAADLVVALKVVFRFWLELLLAYVLALNVLDTPDRRRIVVASLLVAGLTEALVGVLQVVTGAGPSAFRLESVLRAYGTIGQPNPFAGYLELVVPLGLALVLVWRPLRSDWLWWLALTASLVGGAAIVMSYSRGAWLGLIVGLGIGAAVVTRRGWRVVMTGAALSALVVAAIDLGLLRGAIDERLTQAVEDLGVFDARAVIPTDANFAVVERMAHWQAGLAMLIDHPLVGVGPGHYALAYSHYAILPYWKEALGHAHNIYMNVAAENGLIGLVTYLLMVGIWLALCLRKARRLGAEEPTGLSRAIVVGVLACLVAVSVHNVFDNLYVHMLNVQVGLLLGLAVVAEPYPPGRTLEPVRRARGQVLALGTNATSSESE